MFCLLSPTQPSSGRTIADPEHYPRTIGFMPSYLTEARIYAKHILSTKPEAKIAVLYQNDDFGKGYLKGLRDELGPDRASMIVKEGPLRHPSRRSIRRS
jgi:branched-chain amino acid transport system substrate-binding protein